jgi:hypothetical protein
MTRLTDAARQATEARRALDERVRQHQRQSRREDNTMTDPTPEDLWPALGRIVEVNAYLDDLPRNLTATVRSGSPSTTSASASTATPSQPRSSLRSTASPPGSSRGARASPISQTGCSPRTPAVTGVR